MEMAHIASRRSTCHRLNVGAIVTQDNSPVSVGWNGQEPGAPHCAGNNCPGIIPGNCGTLHAELNALTKAGTLLSKTGNLAVDLYVTNSPCRLCSDFILNDTMLEVRRIFFEISYRDTSHLSMFHSRDEAGITKVYMVTPAGYIVEYFSRRVVELP